MIEAEIAVLSDHPWAGQYYYGNGLGSGYSLVVAPSAGFAFIGASDMGVYDENCGPVGFWDGRLHLQCERDNETLGVPGIAKEFVPVRWEERLYLIPPDQMIAFASDVNACREPRPSIYGDHYLRYKDVKTTTSKPTTGPPQLPEEFAHVWSMPKITGKIVELLARRDLTSERYPCLEFDVLVDVGRRGGAYAGMQLSLPEDSAHDHSPFVKEVREDESVVVIKHCGSHDLTVPEPKVGWRFSRWTEARPQERDR